MTRKQIALLAAAADTRVALTAREIHLRAGHMYTDGKTLRILEAKGLMRRKALRSYGYVNVKAVWIVTDAGHAALEQILSERSTAP